MTQPIQWPQRTRHIHNHHMDSTFWDDVVPREDDIIIATWAKSGTTWVQQMIAQLLFDGDGDLEVAHMSPWIDLRVPPRHVKIPAVEGQTHRRFMKTHLPVDALRFFPTAKYVFIGRDARDIVWSMHNHHINANAKWYAALNDTPGRVGPPIAPPPADRVRYFSDWLDNDGFPFWPYWENVKSWWDIRHLPNVRLLHYENMKADLPGTLRMLSEYLDIPIREERFDTIVEHCSFPWMKANATRSTPLGGEFWDEGAKVFVHRGVNGRWRDELPADLSARFERTARDQMGDACAEWTFTGRGV